VTSGRSAARLTDGLAMPPTAVIAAADEAVASIPRRVIAGFNRIAIGASMVAVRDHGSPAPHRPAG